jgi:hypothetical protein
MTGARRSDAGRLPAWLVHQSKPGFFMNGPG